MVMVGHSKRLAEPLSRRQKRWMAASLAVLVLAVVGAAAFSVAGGDTSDTSQHGCVNLIVASSLGGARLHYCGGAARTFCRSAQEHSDAISLQARPQCVLAGYRPVRSSG